ncbi:hypothetical protein MHYP_G00325330 [Metynnis hypsauchen]
MHEGFWAWLMVLALHSGIVDSIDSVQASCNDDVTLPCAVRQQQNKYRYIVWYRQNIAILKRKNNEVTFYNKSSPASLGVREALVLQQVQPYDSGQYQCFLAADIGEKDAESYVSLNVSECPTMRPTWPTTSNQCLFEVVEIPALWAVLPFILLCLVKVAICFITILVCQKIRGSGKQKHTSHTYAQSSDYSSRNRKI